MLNLTQLKVLEAVVRHGSVTVAAKELHYSQPSISHHLGGWKPPPGPSSSNEWAAESDSLPKGSCWLGGRQRSWGE
ncbi:MAG TPA: LysR family transcriptional regulator [Propionibacteriaceae bacterium]|nr:LysR family transcriptional regulator [Propionibacteriaceae bacterium]